MPAAQHWQVEHKSKTQDNMNKIIYEMKVIRQEEHKSK